MRFVSVVALLATGSSVFAGSVGQQVVNFNQGTASVVVAPYTNLAGAVGLPAGNTTYGALTPFNPAFSTSHLLGIGANGTATIKLSGPIVVNASAKIGVFDNTGIADEDPESAFDEFSNFTAGGRGFAGTPPFAFGGGVASVSVSADGITFVPVGTDIEFNMPTNAYTDNDINLGLGSIGTQSADFFKPFNGTLSSFAGLRYNDPSNPDMLDLLDGSGGGTWLDVSGVALPTIQYVKFDVPTGGRLLLDSVTAIPEPASLSALLAGAMILRRRR